MCEGTANRQLNVRAGLRLLSELRAECELLKYRLECRNPKCEPSIANVVAGLLAIYLEVEKENDRDELALGALEAADRWTDKTESERKSGSGKRAARKKLAPAGNAVVSRKGKLDGANVAAPAPNIPSRVS